MQHPSSQPLKSRSRGLAVTLVVLGVIGAAGCKGDPGASGKLGQTGNSCTVKDNENGTKTITCADGTTVSVIDGQAGGSCTVADNGNGTKTITCTEGTPVTVRDGAACWDLNANGQPDVATEDADGDGLVNVEDCAGAAGSNGTNGNAGANCWDLNGDGLANLPAEDRNGDGIVNVADCDGASTGPLVGRVIDADTYAVLSGVVVSTYPQTTTVTSDAGGSFAIANVPIGMYEVRAEGKSVEAVPVEATVGPVTLLAVGGANVNVRLRRIPATWMKNIPAYHYATNTTLFTNATCAICHTDRTGEKALDPTIKPFHAITFHSNVGCVFCHSSIDLRHESAAQLRKNVSTTKCTGCHPSFPVLK